MLCTTLRNKQYDQQLAGSTIGQMDAYTQIHSDCHLFMQFEAYMSWGSDKVDKLDCKVQSDFLHYSCNTNTRA